MIGAPGRPEAWKAPATGTRSLRFARVLRRRLARAARHERRERQKGLPAAGPRRPRFEQVPARRAFVAPVRSARPGRMMDTALQLRSRYLLEPTFWRPRLERLRATRRSLIFTPRPDLSSLLVEVDEWRLRAHDGERLWGLRARSSFHPDPFGATVRLVTAPARPEIDVAVVAEGQVEWVLQVAPGRRLEDRVLDLVRLREVAAELAEDPDGVRFAHPEDAMPDEVAICAGLRQKGII